MDSDFVPFACDLDVQSPRLGHKSGSKASLNNCTNVDDGGIQLVAAKLLRDADETPSWLKGKREHRAVGAWLFFL